LWHGTDQARCLLSSRYRGVSGLIADMLRPPSLTRTGQSGSGGPEKAVDRRRVDARRGEAEKFRLRSRSAGARRLRWDGPTLRISPVPDHVAGLPYLQWEHRAIDVLSNIPPIHLHQAALQEVGRAFNGRRHLHGKFKRARGTGV
jgi:hypothetical protein